jgi:leucyl-tRNA synthetase
VKKVDRDVNEFKFNTAIAAMMEWLNDVRPGGVRAPVLSEAIETLVLALAPFAPHIAEELWEMIGGTESVHLQSFPSWDERLASSEVVTIAVQINGKLRERLEVPAGTDKQALVDYAMKSEKIRKLLKGREPERVIVVPGKVVNLVVS